MNEASLIGLLEATVSFGALLYLAALGEMITEKAGILTVSYRHLTLPTTPYV